MPRSSASASTAGRVRSPRPMDLTLSPAEEAFRDELRAWLAANNPGREPAGDEAAFEFRRRWQRTAARGRAGPACRGPSEYGGRGATLVEQAIFNEEMVRARTPQVANVLGLAMGGPTVIAHGTEEQRRRYLPPILSARGDLVPGLLRARLRLRPCVAEDARCPRRRRVGRDRAEGLDDVCRTTRSGACWWRGPTRTLPSTRG